MAKRGSTDIHSDAPPSAMKDPNPAEADLTLDDDSGDLKLKGPYISGILKF